MKPLSSLFTCLLGIYFCVAIVNTQIELPRQPVGFKYVPTPAASPSSKFLTVKVFLDILCPDSYRAFRLLLNIMPRYCDQGVRLTVVLFPLPFHQHSYVLTKVRKDLTLFIQIFWLIVTMCILTIILAIIHAIIPHTGRIQKRLVFPCFDLCHPHWWLVGTYFSFPTKEFTH